MIFRQSLCRTRVVSGVAVSLGIKSLRSATSANLLIGKEEEKRCKMENGESKESKRNKKIKK